MDFNEYEKAAGDTAIYPNRGTNIVYPVLGLAGESGEVAEKTKKLIRDRGGKIDDEFIMSISKELGDLMWYIAAVCHEIGVPMDDVAQLNIAKLRSRKNRGVLHGSGDNR